MTRFTQKDHRHFYQTIPIHGVGIRAKPTGNRGSDIGFLLVARFVGGVRLVKGIPRITYPIIYVCMFQVCTGYT